MSELPPVLKYLGPMDPSGDTSEERPGDGTTRPIRLRHLAKHHAEIFEEVVSELAGCDNGFVDRVSRKSQRSSRRYLSDVVTVSDPQSLKRLVSVLSEYGPTHRGVFFFYVVEGDHVHVVHDCAYSNSSCRCAFSKTHEFRRGVRPSLRRRRLLGEFEWIDWANVFIYFFLEKQPHVAQIRIDGALSRLPTADQIVRWQRMRERVGQHVLESEGEGVRHDSPSEFPDNDKGTLHLQSSSQGPQKKRSKFEALSIQVSKILDKYVVIPPESVRDVIAHSPDYRINLHDPTQEKNYLNACKLYMLKLNRFSFSDFKEFYTNKEPIFYANCMNPFEYYHTPEESLKVLDDLLMYQFDGHDENVAEFLTNLRNWFDREGWDNNPKMNALVIIGPPNSGKNYFFDCLVALACNVGHIGRVNNKTNQFALQDAYCRRMVVGNEISMEDGAKEDFKKLCEGTAFNIRVKYQGDKIFTKTPVLLISNGSLEICSDPHFRDVRLKTFRWRQASLLKEYKKKPYPLCIFDLMEKYNVTIYVLLFN